MKPPSSAIWNRSSSNWAATGLSSPGKSASSWTEKIFISTFCFYHRRLRRLVVIDLKLGKFAPADLGQMEFYVRWLKKHLAHAVIEKCFHKGLLFFSPIGAWGQTVKIAPPLTITEEALRDGLAVLNEAIGEILSRT